MTVMDESGPTPGITTISIKTDRQPGNIRIIVFNGEVKSEIINIPIRTTRKA